MSVIKINLFVESNDEIQRFPKIFHRTMNQFKANILRMTVCKTTKFPNRISSDLIYENYYRFKMGVNSGNLLKY